MTKNPFLNAAAATAYIAIVATVMFFGNRFAGPANSIVGPIAFISLFTLSAAVMGFLFLSQPLQMYLDGKKKQAVKLFIQTLLSFAGITAVLLGLLFFRILE